MTDRPVTLKRSLSLLLITYYGLGNILGAGIYVLVGKVAGYAGMLVPLSFLSASLLAALTALSYAELSSRYPLSAGEAVVSARRFCDSFSIHARGDTYHFRRDRLRCDHCTRLCRILSGACGRSRFLGHGCAGYRLGRSGGLGNC